MAVKGTYIMKSATFTKDGGMLQTITGKKTITIEQGGQVVAQGSDDDVTVTAHFLDNEEVTITIETSDLSLFVDGTNFAPGVVGALVIVMQKREKGKGAVSGADETITAAQAMVGPRSASLPREGESSLPLVFHCSDPAGVAALAFS